MSFRSDRDSHLDAENPQERPCCDPDSEQEQTPQGRPDQPQTAIFRKPIDEPDSPHMQPQPAIFKFVQRHIVLAEAPAALNRPDQPWQVTVEGDSIIARWKCEDTAWFAPHELTDDIRDFSFTVTLSERGSWTESGDTQNRRPGFHFNDDRMRPRLDKNNLHAEIVPREAPPEADGENQAAASGPELDVEAVQKAVRRYLLSCGYRSMLLMPS